MVAFEAGFVSAVLAMGAPLSKACISGHSRLVSQLIGAGADVNSDADQGVTALLWACQHGHFGTAKVLLDAGAAVDVGTTRTGIGPLSVAAVQGHLSMVKLLVKRRASVNQKEHHGSTALHFACQSGFVDVAVFLLDHGANIHAITRKGGTPLYGACQNGHVELVEVLAERGAVIDAPTSQGATPLVIAAQNGHDDVVECLIELGADVNHVPDSAMPALHAACSNAHLSTAKLLVAKGADPFLLTLVGSSALDIALRFDQSECAAFLTEVMTAPRTSSAATP